MFEYSVVYQKALIRLQKNATRIQKVIISIKCKKFPTNTTRNFNLISINCIRQTKSDSKIYISLSGHSYFEKSKFPLETNNLIENVTNKRFEQYDSPSTLYTVTL